MRLARAVGTGLLVTALSGCTGDGGPPDTTASKVPVAAQRLAAEGTVDLIQRWALAHLFMPEGGGAPASVSTTPISEDARRQALGYAIALAQKNTLGCRSVIASEVGTDPYRVQIRVSGCHHAVGPSAGPAPGTASTQACLLPAMPTGPFRRAQNAYLVDAGGPPPRFLESATGAAPGTWYLGGCAR
jgi:hypothetical protein